MHHSLMFLKSQACVRNGPLRRGTFRHREESSPKHEHQEDRRDGWEASENDKAVAAPAALGGRDGVAQRWATTQRGGWFVSLVFTASCHISRLPRCARFWRRFCDKLRNFFTQLCLLLASLQTPHAAQSPLFADVCRHLASSAAAAASMAEHWPAKQVICGKLCTLHHYILVWALSTSRR